MFSSVRLHKQLEGFGTWWPPPAVHGATLHDARFGFSCVC